MILITKNFYHILQEDALISWYIKQEIQQIYSYDTQFW